MVNMLQHQQLAVQSLSYRSALLEFKRIPKEMVQEINLTEICDKEEK